MSNHTVLSLLFLVPPFAIRNYGGRVYLTMGDIPNEGCINKFVIVGRGSEYAVKLFQQDIRIPMHDTVV